MEVNIMLKNIAVEQGLENVSEYLSNQGLNVSNLDRNNLNNYDAIVVSGQDDDFMGIKNAATKAPVINATGQTPVDIYNQIRNTFI